MIRYEPVASDRYYIGSGAITDCATSFGAAVKAVTTQTVYCRFRFGGDPPTSKIGYLVSRMNGTQGLRLFVDTSSGTGVRVGFGADSTGTANSPFVGMTSDWVSSVVTPRWMDIAATWDGGLAASGIVMYGAYDPSMPMRPLTMASTSNGTTAVSNNASIAYMIGNRFNTGTSGYDRCVCGDIAIVAHWERVLTYGELLKVQRLGPLSVANGLFMCYANGRDYSPYRWQPTLKQDLTIGNEAPQPPGSRFTTNRGMTDGGPAVTVVVDYFLGSDIAAGGWTTNLGAGTGLYTTVDETVESDADYIQSSLNPVTDVVEMKFAAVQTPNSTANHTISYSVRADGTTNLRVDLVCGVTIIKTWTHNPAPAAYTRYDQTLTAGEAATITNYQDLRLRLTAG